MIKLTELLLEAMDKPKAIIMAGGASVGKSTILKSIDSIVKDFVNLNADKYVEDKDSPMYGNLSAASSQIKKKDLPNAIQNQKNLIYDTTASNLSTLQPTLDELNSNGYDVMMIMVYAHPIVSFLRNFKRERKVPKMAVLSTWNSVYGSIDTYKAKLGDNFIMYQAPDEEFAKEISEFNSAVKAGKLYDWFNDLTDQDQDAFKSTLGTKSTEPLSPEEQAKKDKAKEKQSEVYKQQVEQMEREFDNIDKKIKDYVLTEQEIISKVKEFAQ